MHHLVYLQHFVYAEKHTECHEVCLVLLSMYRHFSQTSARCVQGRAEPRSPAVAKVLCNWLTTDLHPIASMPLGESSHFFFVSS